jgi:GAF domain-containing protein
MELFQIQNDEGPGLDCFRTGQPVTAADLGEPGQPWPRFAAAAQHAGFGAVDALPMRLPADVIGALNLFRARPGPLSPEDLRVGQALADIATIGLLQERNVRRSEIAAAQQAKGKLAERLGLNVDDAFRLLRVHARNTNQRLTGTARYVVDHPNADFPPLPRK